VTLLLQRVTTWAQRRFSFILLCQEKARETEKGKQQVLPQKKKKRGGI
jgi:hypothetical protein